MREITYYDISPLAAASANGTVSGNIQGFSNLRNLFAEELTYRSIQTCEHNHTILDGTHREFAKDENIALWSTQQSQGQTREFPQSLTLNVTFGGYHSSPGITFRFDTQNNNWCDKLNIKWYKDGNLLSSKTFEPDCIFYPCYNKVELYNKVTVEFIRMNFPGRFLKIEEILFGTIRVFHDCDLENVTINEGFDPSGRTLYINSANFTIITSGSVSEKLGDVAKISAGFGDDITGQIEKLTLYLGSKNIRARGIIRSE